jgi:hypothetical protein
MLRGGGGGFPTYVLFRDCCWKKCVESLRTVMSYLCNSATTVCPSVGSSVLRRRSRSAKSNGPPSNHRRISSNRHLRNLHLCLTEIGRFHRT